jgi:hypothetical protein
MTAPIAVAMALAVHAGADTEAPRRHPTDLPFQEVPKP